MHSEIRLAVHRSAVWRTSASERTGSSDARSSHRQ